MGRTYYVYLMTNKWNRVLYTGMTNDLARRVGEHKAMQKEGFTKRYRATKLIYYEAFNDVRDAIAREKQIKKGTRQKKLDLIGTLNPEWRDLSDGFW